MADRCRPKRRPWTAARAVSLAAAWVMLSSAAQAPAAAPPVTEVKKPDSTALWRVVHDLCVVDMKVSGLPAPCTAVDLKGGFAVLKDLRGATQLLLIPTARLGGIEAPELLAAETPNYWQAAWSAKPLLEKRVGHAVPREDLGLAINSRYARSQDQLHIHIDCVRTDVLQILKAHEGEIGPAWSDLSVELRGHAYRVMRIDGDTLGLIDPFKRLAESDADARADMGRQSLTVLGAVFADERPGFILLSGRADFARGDRASGEELLDHDCAVLGGGATPRQAG